MIRTYLLSIIFFFIAGFVVAQSWDISLDVSDVTCKGANDGEMNLRVNGADQVSDTVYYWQWMDAVGNIFDTSSDPVTSLRPGAYSVRVVRLSDGSSISAYGTIEEPDSVLAVTKSVLQQNFCARDAAGIVQAQAKGGTGGFQYGLGRGANATGPNYTGGYADNGGLFESLPSGTYSVWVRDSNGCEVGTEDFVITEPEPIRIAYEKENASCEDSGGRIAITAISGGTPFDVNQAGSFNFKIEWRDVSNNSIIATNQAAVSGLSAGTYQIRITDKNSCVRSVGVDLERGFEYEIIETRDISCHTEKNGLIKINLAAGNPGKQEPFAIRIIDKNGNEITSLARSGVTSGQETISGLGPGFYKIKVTDALGCVKEREAIINEPDRLRMDGVNVVDVKCKGGNDGEIHIQAAGGTGNYLYSIDSGASYSNVSVITNVSAGTYDLFLQDDAGCTYNAGDVVVREPSTGYGVEEVKTTNVLCNGKSDGVIEIFFSDSTDPGHLDEDKDIRWLKSSSGELIQEGSQIISGLSEGNYEVRIVDDYGCTFSRIVTIDRKYELRADFSMEATRFAVDYPVKLIDKSLGEGIISWLWDFGNGAGSTETDPEVVYEEPGSYIISLAIQNEVGCDISTADTITIEKGFHLTLPSAFTPNDDRLNDTFRPKFENIKQLQMRIINNDGIQVYTSEDLSASWDGRYGGADAPQGLYYYEVEYTTGSGIMKKEKGKVFLLR